jgi:hypothetical protein
MEKMMEMIIGSIKCFMRRGIWLPIGGYTRLMFGDVKCAMDARDWKEFIFFISMRAFGMSGCFLACIVHQFEQEISSFWNPRKSTFLRLL